MPGELVGAYKLLLPGGVPSPVTLRADTDAVSLLHFSRELLFELMTTLPAFGIGCRWV